jgi:hypothetical protein
MRAGFFLRRLFRRTERTVRWERLDMDPSVVCASYRPGSYDPPWSWADEMYDCVSDGARWRDVLTAAGLKLGPTLKRARDLADAQGVDLPNSIDDLHGTALARSVASDLGLAP